MRRNVLGGEKVMNLRGCTPCVLTIKRKMASLVTAFALVSVGAFSSLMGTLTDGTGKGLTRVPHPTGVTVNITLEGVMLVQRH